MNATTQSYWGEGCGLAMETTEVPAFDSFDHRTGTKPHGRQPPLCSGTSLGRGTADRTCIKVVKRSLQRAHRRAQYMGHAWYKGRSYGPEDFVRMGCPPIAAPAQPTISKGLHNDWTKCQTRHSRKGRLHSWHWNCGGLSAGKLDEVKAWLHLNCVQVAALTETRWTFDSDWLDSRWYHIHSGEGPGRGKGILVLISRQLCSPTQIRYQHFISGRLVHVRLLLQPRPIDLVFCYQYTYQASRTCLQSRETWWKQLENILDGIPNRHALLLCGDFNCHLTSSPGISGTDTFTWKGCQRTGVIHSDHHRFLHILRNNALVALNTWSSALGPTFVQGDKVSRLDYFCVRQMFADGEARRVSYLPHSPFLHHENFGHIPMMCTIARHWIPQFHSAQSPRITLQQRQASREAYIQQTATWQTLMLETQEHLDRLFQRNDLTAHQLTDKMHSDLMPIFVRAFPPGHVARCPPDWQPALPTILNKWDHRRAMLHPTICTAAGVFRVWFHMSQFLKLKKLHAKQSKQIRTQRFREVVTTAAEAAAQHNTHKLFHIINKYAPKQPKKQIQLRNQAGHMATPVECDAILNQYVATAWKGPSTNALDFACAPGVPFTLHQLETALSKIPATKATAKHCLPGVIWKQLAPFFSSNAV